MGNDALLSFLFLERLCNLFDSFPVLCVTSLFVGHISFTALILVSAGKTLSYFYTSTDGKFIKCVRVCVCVFCVLLDEKAKWPFMCFI